jgi:hypothetical protein
MGFLLALLSACSATAKDIVSKAVASRVHPSILTFASCAFALPFYVNLLALSPLFGADPLVYTGSFAWLVLARSISDIFEEGFIKTATKHLPRCFSLVRCRLNTFCCLCAR